ERPAWEHQCYILLTRKADNRQVGSSLLSNLLRRSLAPVHTLQPQPFLDFLDQAGQFERVLQDSGFVRLRRLKAAALTGTPDAVGLLERYCGLLPAGSPPLLQDISLQDGIRIGDRHCQLFTLADAADLPALCGP